MKKRVGNSHNNKSNPLHISAKPIIILIILNIIALVFSFFASVRLFVAIIISILTLVTFIYAGYTTTKKFKQPLKKAFAVGLILGIIQGILSFINMLLMNKFIAGYKMPVTTIMPAILLVFVAGLIVGGIATLSGLFGKIKKK